MPDRDSAYLAGGGGGGSGTGVGSNIGEEAGAGAGLGGVGEGWGGIGGGVGGCVGGSSGSSAMGGGGALGNGNGCGGGGSGGFGSGAGLDGVCRDFLRNVCKRGKRCRFRHPDFNEVPDLGVQKNEFIFCHDHQNKECVRSNCRFVHGSKEDEDYYKKTGELPLRLRGKVAAGLGLSPTDLPLSRGEVPICRDYLKGECQRGNKCKFRHVRKDYDYEPSRVGVGGVIGPGGVSGMVNAGGGGVGGTGGACGGISGLVGGSSGNMMGMGYSNLGGYRDQSMAGVGGGGGGGGMGGCLSMSASSQRRYDRASVYDPLFENGLFETGPLETPMDHATLQLKRRRLEGLRLADGGGTGHYELGVQATFPVRPLEYRILEEENALLRKRVEELKKQVGKWGISGSTCESLFCKHRYIYFLKPQS